MSLLKMFDASMLSSSSSILNWFVNQNVWVLSFESISSSSTFLLDLYCMFVSLLATFWITYLWWGFFFKPLIENSDFSHSGLGLCLDEGFFIAGEMFFEEGLSAKLLFCSSFFLGFKRYSDVSRFLYFYSMFFICSLFS